MISLIRITVPQNFLNEVIKALYPISDRAAQGQSPDEPWNCVLYYTDVPQDKLVLFEKTFESARVGTIEFYARASPPSK